MRMSFHMSDKDQIKLNEILTVSTDVKELAPHIFHRENAKSQIGYILKCQYSVLLQIQEIKENYNHLSYINIINKNLPSGILPIRQTTRVESNLEKKCNSAKQCLRKAKGRKKYAQLQSETKLIIPKNDICSPNEVHSIKEKCARLELEIAFLYNSLRKLQSKLNKETHKSANLLNAYTSTNEKLNEYITNLNNDFQHYGKPLHLCKRTQVNQNLSVLKSRIHKALWFSKSFGISINNITISDHSGKKYFLSSENMPSVPYSKMSEYQKDKIKGLLFILDKFGVSDEAYHELTLHNDNMVKSYIIKQCRNEVNTHCHISNTPGGATGAQLSFNEELQRILSEITEKSDGQVPSSLKLKLAADGAKMSRLTNFLVLSLAVIGEEDNVLSCHGQRTLAIVNASENYENVKTSFADIFLEVNKMLEQKDDDGNVYVTFKEKKVLVDFYLGGDMKFLLMATGLNAANAKYSCLYCKIDKSDRGDISNDLQFYNNPPMIRTLDTMRQLVNNKNGKNYGCVNQPLLSLEINKIVVDELHLMMRISDVLIRNLIENAVRADQKVNIGKKSGNQRNKTLNIVVECINSCGVVFDVWERKMKDGKGDVLKNLDWTSLTGTDMKKVLSYLPEILEDSGWLHDEVEIKNAFIALIREFKCIYNIISSTSPSDTEKTNLFDRSRSWVKAFVDLGRYLEGFDKKFVIPYMHILVYHVPKLIIDLGNIKDFSGQGVEKSNDDIKLIYHRKSNKHAATVDALRVRQRKLLTRSYVRIKRKYIKRKPQFWEGRKRPPSV